MLIRRRRGWEMPESSATPESAYLGRRQVLQAIAAGPVLAPAATLLGMAGAGPLSAAETAGPPDGPYPVPRNERYIMDRPLTAEELVTTYNNFYEFGSQKGIWRAAQALETRPWAVRIAGMVEKEMTVDIDTLVRRMPLEERLYRHRCVEAWSMAVPWSGFPLKALVDFARPLGGAKYLRMETFMNPDVASGQKAFWYPWPYVEGLTLAEATNELAFIATGLYGKAILPQNGAPLRLAVPWKYGFKSIKSIILFEFTDKRPKVFWEAIQAREYGFWANVNPQVPHPRWSQAEERILGEGTPFGWTTVPTQLYNGYGEFVAQLYDGLENEKLFM